MCSDTARKEMQPQVAPDFKSGWWYCGVYSGMIQSEGKTGAAAAETGRFASDVVFAEAKRLSRKGSRYEFIGKNTDAEKRKRMVAGRTGREA